VNEQQEVCVVGAGPAGAVLAARLSDLGHDVTVVEREPFPRPHIGESLSPAAWPLLDALGVGDEVRAAGFERTRQARVRWRTRDDERLRPARGSEDACGLTVDRARFDAILLERARAAGATVRTGTAARRPAPSGSGWDIAVAGGVLRAGFVADATGRRRLLGERRTTTSVRTLALHAIWRGRPPSDGAQTWIDAVAEGWLWGARLPGGGLRAIVFVDPQLLVEEGRERERLYRRLLASSPLFAALTRSATIASRVQACDATSYVAPAPIDAHSVKVGEACFAIDPLSSCGVQTAMQSAICAAAAVHSILVPDGDSAAAARAFYAEYQRHAAASHAATAAGLYAEHRADGDAPFWRRRAAQASPQAAAPVPAPVRPAAPGAGGSLAELLPLRVRLRPDAELRTTPCLVGERIELRRALAHAALERPVAFLGSSELAPLLDGLPASASLADAIRRWDRRLPPGRGHEIARWLHARGLIERAP